MILIPIRFHMNNKRRNAHNNEGLQYIKGRGLMSNQQKNQSNQQKGQKASEDNKNNNSSNNGIDDANKHAGK